MVIADYHTNVILVKLNGQIIKKTPLKDQAPGDDEKSGYMDIDGIWDFIQTVNPSKLDIIRKSININKKI